MTDDTSQHSLIDHAETSCGPEGPEKQQGMLADELKVVDLRLKSETITRDSQSQVKKQNQKYIEYGLFAAKAMLWTSSSSLCGVTVKIFRIVCYSLEIGTTAQKKK